MRSDNMALYRDLTLYNFVYIESGWLLLDYLCFTLYNMDFTFNIFLQLFISNLNVVTNMSSGVTSNSKYTTYGSLRIGGQILS